VLFDWSLPELMADELDQLQERIGYRFSDLALLQQALTHASLCSEPACSNERLEFLGDAVAGLVIAEDLYCLGPDLTEGQMSAVKSVAASREAMGRVAEELALDEFLRVDRSVEAQGEYPFSLLGNVYEAIAGAIFVDGGFAEARRFVLRTLGPEIQRACQRKHVLDFKSVLQQMVQAEGKPAPTYRTLSRRGPDHDASFRVAVRIEGRDRGQGWGKSKKAAEQQAAHDALNGMYPSWKEDYVGD